MRSKTVVGLAFLAVGFLLLSGIVSLSVSPAYKFQADLYPGGSQQAPIELEPGSTISLRASIVYYGLPSAEYWTATVNVSGQVKDLALRQNSYEFEYEEGVKKKIGYAVFETPWVVPANLGASYTFTWKIEIRGSTGSVEMTKILASYAKTPEPEEVIYLVPDGYVALNGQRIESGQIIETNSSQLSVSYIATQNAQNIAKMSLIVKKGDQRIASFSMTKSGEAFTRDYRIPSAGQYTFEIYMKKTYAPDYELVHSFTVKYSPPSQQGGDDGQNGGGDNEQTGSFFTMSRVIGLTLVVIGAVVLARRD